MNTWILIMTLTVSDGGYREQGLGVSVATAEFGSYEEYNRAGKSWFESMSFRVDAVTPKILCVESTAK